MTASSTTINLVNSQQRGMKV